MAYPPAFTNIWDITFPPDTQAANLLGQDLRNLAQNAMQRLSSLAGTLANRPTPETVNATWGGVGFGILYFALDTHQVFQWNGSAWVDVTSEFPTGGVTTATALATTGSPVDVSAAAPPTANQVLKATDATHATWQTLSTAPTGAAGGDLSGNYPNPGVAEVNGAAIPLSAGYLGSNGSRQLIAVATPSTVAAIVQKFGSGGGAYTITGSQVDVDGTNLADTIVIPVGKKLLVEVYGTVSTSGAGSCRLFIVDGLVTLNNIEIGGVTSFFGFSMKYVITGDGASHTVSLQAITVAGGSNIQNSGTQVPVMVFTLLDAS